MITAADKKTMADYFRNRPHVQTVYLFGSQSKKRARPESDVDLALLLSPDVNEERYLEERLDVMAELSQRLGREVDAIILNEAGPVLVHQVLRDGKLLHQTNPRRTFAFKAKAMIDYVDWLPFQARLDQSVLRYFRAHGGR